MQGTRDLQRAPVIEQLWDLRVPTILEKVAYGLDCFDCQFYREHYEDVFPMTCWDAFVHFINFGQFENRVHRCDPCSHVHQAGRDAQLCAAVHTVNPPAYACMPAPYLHGNAKARQPGRLSEHILGIKNAHTIRPKIGCSPISTSALLAWRKQL